MTSIATDARVDVVVPGLGDDLPGGTIRWLRAVGDAVVAGDPLFEIDTDKVTQEIEAEATGTLLEILVTGGEVAVGACVAVLGPATLPAGTPAPSTRLGRLQASPLARRLAREHGLELAAVEGTGPEGRIVAEDVERAARVKAAPVAATTPVRLPAGGTRVPLGPTRQAAARRLTEARQAPAFQVTVSADMTRSLALRELAVAQASPEAVRPSVSDVIVRAVASALVRHPEVNARVAGDAIELHGPVSIGIATATERGLVVPVIHDAAGLTIAQIATARATLVERALAGTLTREETEGGTFTISNLGPFGVESFVAVLDPPQAAILAVASVEDRPVARDGQVVIRPMITVTMTCDHRALDGAAAATFLGTVRSFLEEPALQL